MMIGSEKDVRHIQPMREKQSDAWEESQKRPSLSLPLDHELYEWGAETAPAMWLSQKESGTARKPQVRAENEAITKEKSWG